MTLFPPQEQVINNGLLEKSRHCLLNMTTGSGKTYLAELAMESVLQSGYKAIYVTPLRALAYQQKENWSHRFSDYTIGVFTGETIQKSSTKSCYSKSQILIMTPERLDACMRNWRSHWSWIPEVSLVIVDEFHILGTPGRGPRLEGTITRLMRLNPFTKIIGLSATIPNVKELSLWLDGIAYRSTWRQVPIEKRIIRYKSANEKPALLIEEVKRCIEAGGQSLIFCNSRSRVQSLALLLHENGIDAKYHHAGLLQEQRKKVEDEFILGKTKALVATSTLEMGLNLPARQVIIYDSYTFSEKGFSTLPVWSFIQRAGRAGRPGLDSNGEVVLFLSKWAGSSRKYVNEECEPVYSQLSNNKSMQEQILIDVFSGFSRTREELVQGFLPLTLYRHQHKEANINGVINKLLVTDLLYETITDNDCNTILKVGLLGRLAVKLMFAPSTVKLISDCYSSFQRMYLFDLLLIAALSEDCSPILPANYEEIDTLCKLVRRQPSTLMDLPIDKLKKLFPDEISTLRILAGIKMSVICLCLINDDELSDISDKFDVFESDTLLLKDSMERVLTGISAVVSAIDKSRMDDDYASEQKADPYSIYNMNYALINMLRYQIPSELIALTKLDGVGGKTAKLLAKHGYTSLEMIAKADPSSLLKIKGIGPKLSESICHQAIQILNEGNAAIYSETLLSDIYKDKSIKTAIDPYRLRRSMELYVKGVDGSVFHIAGGREDHVVIRDEQSFTCDCLDFKKRNDVCKHILCVKRTLGHPEILKMVKRIKENQTQSIRESLPSLWYSVTSKEV